MPGATTARLVVCDSEMPMKLFMMPQTVPNSPTKGAVAPIVAEHPGADAHPPPGLRLDARRGAKRSAGMQPLPARRGAAPPPRRRASYRAARTISAAGPRRPASARSAAPRSLAPEDRPEAAAQPRLAARISRLLASQTVQVSSDATASPTITAFTTTSAAMEHAPGRQVVRQRAEWALGNRRALCLRCDGRLVRDCWRSDGLRGTRPRRSRAAPRPASAPLAGLSPAGPPAPPLASPAPRRAPPASAPRPALPPGDQSSTWSWPRSGRAAKPLRRDLSPREPRGRSGDAAAPERCRSRRRRRHAPPPGQTVRAVWWAAPPHARRGAPIPRRVRPRCPLEGRPPARPRR